MTDAKAWAQLDILQPPPTLPSLPQPPTLSHLMLESPIPLSIAAIALALAAWAVANRLGRARQGLIAAAGFACLGLVVVGVSFAIRTPREQVIRATEALVDAVARADDPALSEWLGEDVRLFVRGSRSGWDKPRILGWVHESLAQGGTYAVAGHRVSDVQAEVGPSGEVARSRADVVVTPVGDLPPTRFVCMLTWRLDAGQWRLVEIDPLWLQGWGEISDRDMLRPQGW
ncbi:MAG: nuclear transport factor 2 family protein [Phycisphaerales bacterium]|nr:nuclear transport factor 2 family protein [Phycisphaerales bacterium]